MEGIFHGEMAHCSKQREGAEAGGAAGKAALLHLTFGEPVLGAGCLRAPFAHPAASWACCGEEGKLAGPGMERKGHSQRERWDTVGGLTAHLQGPSRASCLHSPSLARHRQRLHHVPAMEESILRRVLQSRCGLSDSGAWLCLWDMCAGLRALEKTTHRSRCHCKCHGIIIPAAYELVNEALRQPGLS